MTTSFQIISHVTFGVRYSDLKQCVSKILVKLAVQVEERHEIHWQSGFLATERPVMLVATVLCAAPA
jgi:hypothetical protein